MIFYKKNFIALLFLVSFGSAQIFAIEPNLSADFATTEVPTEIQTIDSVVTETVEQEVLQTLVRQPNSFCKIFKNILKIIGKQTLCFVILPYYFEIFMHELGHATASVLLGNGYSFIIIGTPTLGMIINAQTQYLVDMRNHLKKINSIRINMPKWGRVHFNFKSISGVGLTYFKNYKFSASKNIILYIAGPLFGLIAKYPRYALLSGLVSPEKIISHFYNFGLSDDSTKLSFFNAIKKTADYSNLFIFLFEFFYGFTPSNLPHIYAKVLLGNAVDTDGFHVWKNMLSILRGKAFDKVPVIARNIFTGLHIFSIVRLNDALKNELNSLSLIKRMPLILFATLKGTQLIAMQFLKNPTFTTLTIISSCEWPRIKYYASRVADYLKTKLCVDTARSWIGIKKFCSNFFKKKNSQVPGTCAQY